MRVAVVLSTYNQPAALEKVLWGYAVQTHREFEVVVADDGSTGETAELIGQMGRTTGMAIRHVWHEDAGFRKCEILNRAIVAASAEYLIFSDGDCVPRADFVATHVQNAAPGRFLSGGYLKLPAEVSDRITREAITSGEAFRMDWLRAQGWWPGRRALRLLPPGPATVLDAITPTRASWNGHNASAAREALLRVNGYDMEMGYGGEDRALGERLQNLGMRGVQIRHRAPCLHLHHERPYVDADVVRENRRRRESIRREHRVRAARGIAELSPGPA
jgi:glycosyltransferase involved in cell wall biosynthesis